MSHFHHTHKMCAVCGSEKNNDYSLGAEFSLVNKQTVRTDFTVLPRHQGYLGLLHGGIASSLLDGAMTHCLLNLNIAALTAQLDVRYHTAVNVGEQLEVIGELINEKRGVYFLRAYLKVAGETRVSASGKFIASTLAEGLGGSY